MNILTGLAGLVIGAVVAWQVAREHAAAELSRVRALFDEQIDYWQDEAERATTHAAQLTEKTAAWAAGCQQGREDILSVTRALAQRPAGMGDPPETD
jgi:hypothetical protein